MGNIFTNALANRSKTASNTELLLAMNEALTMANARSDSYRRDVSGGFVPLEIIEQGSYKDLYEAYTGQQSSAMQLGVLFAQPICKFFTAFEIGRLPQAVVRERTTQSGAGKGAKINELSTFVNGFFKAQHTRLVDMCHTKHLYGDVYPVFGLDRNIESLSPYPAVVSPGFNIFNDKLFNMHTKVTRIVQDEEGEKSEVTVTRYWDSETIMYLAESDDPNVSLSKFVAKPKIKLPNTLGVPPVLHLANNPLGGSRFGWSQFHPVLPYMKIFHDIIVSGYQAQQYHGKPILMITGIATKVSNWLKRSFGIDVTNVEADTTKSAMMDFFERHKFFAFADQVKAEFIESKYPVGATTEMAKLSFQCIVKVSTVPEFMFGVAIESANASVREQYVPLKAIIRDKQSTLAPVLQQLAKWAIYYYSTVSVNPTSGQPLDTYGFISDPTKLDELEIDLIWPPLMNSDEALRIEALTILKDMQGLSFRTAYENLPEFVPDAELELERIREEFNDAGLPPKEGKSVSDGKDASQRRTDRKSARKRDDKGNAGDNSGRTGTGTK